MPDAASALASALGDRYVIERELGRGGMAVVYLARDVKHDRPVAIKVLHADLAASLGAERFLREIQIAARLAHPHILPLIDSGESGGALYYVSPHVPDGSLRDRLAAGAVPVADAVRIAREVGTALDYAHRQGFVHRDVKPDNILFADGHAVLADFGIARACRAAVPDATRTVTEAGLTLGTPEYMSPEQASGEQDLGARSDLYSLACVTYEMLAGEPPLRGSGARATMALQVTEAPRPLRALRADAPPHVERALARALAKDPDARFPTVADFLAALETPAAEGSVAAPAVRAIAVLPFVNASPDAGNEYLSDGITDELIDALAKVEGLRVASRTSVFALKGRPQDVRSIGAALGAAWVLEGSVRRAGRRLRVTAQLCSTDDGRLLWSQRYDRTLDDVFAIQEELARTIVDTLRATSFAALPQPPHRRYTDNVKAYALYLRGRHAWNLRSPEGVNQAIAFFEQAIAEDPRYAPAYAGLADSYALGLDYRSVPVAEGFAHAKEAARRALELDDTVAEAHASLAWTLFIHDWDWNASEREFRRALSLDPRYATAHQWYTFLLAARGRLEDAVAEVHAALELDPASVSIRRSVGWAYFYARRYDQARYHLARALAMDQTAEETHRVLALTLAQQAQWDEAAQLLRDGLALGQGIHTHATLGYVLARAGDPDPALQLVRELEELRARQYISPVALATLEIGLGRLDRALDWAECAYAERRGWPVYFNVNPVVDPLRAEPRFRALVERLQL